MNIKEEIYEVLRSKGCYFYEEAGILFITTPNGDLWDMTIPMFKKT